MMSLYEQSIIKKYGVGNARLKLYEEIEEFLSSGSDDELADVYNCIRTLDHYTGGRIGQIAYEKRNRTTFRMAVNWYDDDGQRPRPLT